MKIKGYTIRGRGLGKKLGFPTLNLKYGGEMTGVFLGKVKIGDQKNDSVVHVGKKPTIDPDETSIEVHILDFDQEVELGTEIEIEFLEKIRETKKFDNPDDLKLQIEEDVKIAREWYDRSSS
jgi:riboflavin kinase / FMN adenylyltransferase